ELSPSADPQSRTFAARVAFEAPEAEIELGQSARVFIENPSQSALAVPLAAVSAEAGQSFVWVVESESHRLRRQPVQVGNYQHDRATILQGLEAGDWIVAAGVHMLLDGQQVLPVDRQNRGDQISGERATKLNLSSWALRNRQLVLYFMLVLAVAGVLSYGQLGQSEDPPFTFKAMVVTTQWPGATAEEVAQQISDRIEQKVMETGDYQQVVSYSRPGQSTITFVARDDLPPREIPELWYQLRKKVGDIRHTLPPDIVGPFYNDEFGTTFGNIYALTGEGFDYAVLKDYAERLQLQLQR